MKLSDLMMTDEQRRKVCGCNQDNSPGTCVDCENRVGNDAVCVLHERAAIAHAVVVLEEKLDLHGALVFTSDQTDAQEDSLHNIIWCALLAEARKEVEG